jgi:hypothetical protein
VVLVRLERTLSREDEECASEGRSTAALGAFRRDGKLGGGGAGRLLLSMP